MYLSQGGSVEPLKNLGETGYRGAQNETGFVCCSKRHRVGRHRRRRRSSASHARPEYIAPAFSWAGFYIGGHTGVAVGKTSTSNNAPYGGFDAGGTPLSYNLNPVSIFGGGQVGYNWQRGVWVFGLEGDFGYLGLNES